MVEAKDMKKIINTKWIDDRWADVEASKFGRKAFHIGRHVVPKATSDQFARELTKKGFIISYGVNSHGVKMLIIEW